MISAVVLAALDLIVCSFLTTLGFEQIYELFMTLIVHPGSPTGTCASTWDWLLLGDDEAM